MTLGIKRHRFIDINELNNIINENMQDKDLKSLFYKWLNQEDWKQVLILNQNNSEHIKRALGIQRSLFTGTTTLLSRFVVNEQGLTWGSYCKIMHNLPIPDNYSLHKLYIKLISNFFKFASLYANDIGVRKYLQLYYIIFVDTGLPKQQKKDVNSDIEFIDRNIRTNFPLDSLPHQIIPIRWDREEGTLESNFFIKTDNKFLITLIGRFLENFNCYEEKTLKKFPTWTHNKLYLIYFDESLAGRKIERFEDFNEDTFREQVTYYNSLLETYNFTLKHSGYAPFFLLTKFYQFIDQVYFDAFGKGLFDTSTFNVDLFRIKNYRKIIEEGYQVVVINSLNEVLDSDKWVALLDNRYGWFDRSYIRLNFEEIKNNKLKNDLKNFIWYGIPDKYSMFHYITNLIEFLNDANEFYEETKKLSYLNKATKVKLFSNEFLFIYYRNLMSRSDYKSSSKDAWLSVLRKYLRYYQTEYKIPSLIFKQMKFLNESKYQEGNPISSKDFVVIRNAFQELWQGEDQLLYIIFQLSITTPLRIGEILALERNCIISSNNKSGIVRYISKTSGGRYIEEPFTLETIRLIQKAIKISKIAFEGADKDLKNYIFIGINRNITSRQEVVHLSNRYSAKFSKVIAELYKQGKIDEIYIPYSARDTLINVVYESVEKEEISIIQAKSLTLNSPTVVGRSYLGKKRRTKAYMEAFYELDINKEPAGTILLDEKHNKTLPPIQEKAGMCNSKECVKITEDEDSFYKCLTCNFFITSLERIPVFEEKLEIYKEEIDNSLSKAERNFYKGLAELYASYLTEMYVMLEETIND